MDTATDKKGKTRSQKLADTMFMLGIEVGDTVDSLQVAAEKFADMLLDISLRHFKGEGDKPVQVHTIKGIATENPSEGAEPNF